MLRAFRRRQRHRHAHGQSQAGKQRLYRVHLVIVGLAIGKIGDARIASPDEIVVPVRIAVEVEVASSRRAAARPSKRDCFLDVGIVRCRERAVIDLQQAPGGDIQDCGPPPCLHRSKVVDTANDEVFNEAN